MVHTDYLDINNASSAADVIVASSKMGTWLGYIVLSEVWRWWAEVMKSCPWTQLSTTL
jgi:hypothetical protein